MRSGRTVIVAGVEIDPAAPSYKRTIFRPQPGGGLTFARVTLETLYGRLASGWSMADGVFTYAVVVPPNTNATVILPFAGSVSLNGERVDGLVHELGAGSFEFVVRP